MYYCRCYRCKAAKRKGLILGTRRYGNYCVSAYVPFPRFQKGRTRKEKNVDHTAE